MSVQVEPYQLRFLASRLSAGAQEMLLRANRLESIMNDLVQGSWKGEGAHAFAIKCEMMKSDIQKAVEVLNNAIQTLNYFANQMDRVNQLRQQANMLEQQSWQYGGDSIDELHHRQNLARQAAQIRQEAEWEANVADAQAANEFNTIITMIPQFMEQVSQYMGGNSHSGELDDLPEPLKSYYLRHMGLLQDDEGETAATLTMGSFKQADYIGASNLEKKHDQLVLQAKEILRRKDVEGYITDPAEIKRIVDSSFQLECGDLTDVELEMYVQQNSDSMQLAEKMQNEKHQGIDITKDPEYIAFAMRQGGYEPTGFNPDGVVGMVRGRVFGNGGAVELPNEYGGVSDGYYADHDYSKLVVADKSFLDEQGRILWPPNEGFEGEPEPTKLEVGKIIDRYGSPFGTYTSPAGTPFEERALPYVDNQASYHRYKVLKPIDGVLMGKIAAAFNQPGGGIQYKMPMRISKLISDGYLMEVK